MIEGELIRGEPNKEVLQDRERICVVTSTYYPKFNPSITDEQVLEKIEKLNSKRVELGEDKVRDFEQELTDIIRGRQAMTTFNRASELGVQVVVVDGGSSTTFVEQIGENKNVLIKKQASNGYGGSRREGLHLGRDYFQQDRESIFFMIEPEKGVLLEAKTMNDLTRPIRDNVADIVIPDRGFKVNDDTLDNPSRWGRVHKGEEYVGYPPYQVHSEVWLNEHLKEKMIECGFIKSDDPTFDALNGTRVFRNSTTIVSQLMNCYSSEDESVDSDFYFSAVYALFLSMGSIGRGERIASVPVRFEYPKLQALLESSSPEVKDKRDSQRITISNAIDLWVESYLQYSSQTNEFQPPDDLSWFGFEKENRFKYKSFPAYFRNRIVEATDSPGETKTLTDEYRFPSSIILGKDEIETPVRYNLVSFGRDFFLQRGTGKEIEVVAEIRRLDTRLSRPQVIITDYAVMDDIRVLFRIASDYIDLTDGRNVRFMLPHGNFLPKDVIEEHADLLEKDAIHVSYYESS